MEERSVAERLTKMRADTSKAKSEGMGGVASPVENRIIEAFRDTHDVLEALDSHVGLLEDEVKRLESLYDDDCHRLQAAKSDIDESQRAIEGVAEIMCESSKTYEYAVTEGVRKAFGETMSELFEERGNQFRKDVDGFVYEAKKLECAIDWKYRVVPKAYALIIVVLMAFMGFFMWRTWPVLTGATHTDLDSANVTIQEQQAEIDAYKDAGATLTEQQQATLDKEVAEIVAANSAK